MKIALSKPNDERGQHVVLVCDSEESWKANSVITSEILQNRARPVKETRRDTVIFRFHMRFLDRLSLAFPMAELSDGVYAKLKRAEEKRLAAMPVPTCSWPGFEGTLYDYQKVAAKMVVDGEIDYLNDEMGLGKQAPVSEPVLTPRGWRKIGTIQVGDQVIGSDGKPTEVLGVFPQKDRRVYRVTFSDGSSTRCGPDHLWATQTTNDRFRGSDEWRIVTLQQILDEKPIEKIGSGQNKGKTYTWTPRVKQPNGNRNLCIPMVEPVRFARQSYYKTPIDSYLLGVLLGDGALSSNSVSLTTDPWIIEQFEGVFEASVSDHHLSQLVLVASFRKDLRNVLDSLDLCGKRSWEKFVPHPYLRSTPESRLALLQGLMDTDGYAHPDGGSEFSTTSQKLAKAVVELAQSLGGVARVDKAGRHTTYDYDGEKRTGRRSWRVNVRLPRGVNPFRLPRKADAYKLPEKYEPSRWIESIERDEDEASVCIKVAAEDQLYVTRNYIVTHNTFIALAAIRKLKAFPALVVCPNSAKFTWAEVLDEFFPEVSYAIVDGTKAQRAEAIQKRADVTLVNFEGIRAKPIHEDDNPYAAIIGYEYSNPDLFDFPYSFAVVDEHHRVKTPGAQVTNGFFQLVAEQWLMMSGTPILNRPEEIWTVLHKIYPEEFPSYQGFINTIGIFAPGSTYVVAYRPDPMAELREFIASVSLRRRREQVLKDLPQVVHVPRIIKQSREERKLYEQIRDELLLELEDGTTKNIMGVLPQITRLKQACFSPELYGGSKKSSKIEELKEIVEELVASGEKAIIFSQWSKATRIIERELSPLYGCAYVTGEVKPKDRAAQVRKFIGDDDCKCVLPDTKIEFVGKPLGATRSFHNGPIIELVVGSGQRLSVTPNHPMLTDRGWVAAEFIRKGDKVFNRSSAEPSLATGQARIDFDKIPTSASDLYAAMSVSGSSHIVSRSATGNDFHGDGKFRQGEVDIVSFASGLLVESDSELGEPIGEADFVGSDEKLLAFSGLSLLEASAHRSGLSEPTFSTLSHGNAIQPHSLAESFSGEITLVGENGETFASDVSLDEFSVIQNVSGLDARLPHFDSRIAEAAQDGSLADASAFRNGTSGPTGVVLSDEVVEVKVRHYTGHVYNFQTDSGTYCANQLITHNCYIGTTAANREAINLGIATYVIFTDDGWTPAEKDQAIGRSAAGGLRGAHLSADTKVHVITLQAEDTYEQRIDALLNKKRALFDRMVERDGGKKIEKITVNDIAELL